MGKGKIDILCDYLEKHTARNYPIFNAELRHSTDYMKNAYLKMLAVVIQQPGNISEAQMALLKRIVEGAGTKKEAEDYLRKALEIEVEDYIKFSTECKKMELRYRWVLDAVIITCVNEKKEEQLSLIAEFCESFGITKEELRYIAAMAKAIVTMNLNEYVSVLERKVDHISDAVFSDYLFLISKSCVCGNGHMTIFQPTLREEVTVQVLDQIQGLRTPCIKFIGVEIALEEYNLHFQNREKVILEGCCFRGGRKYAITFDNCSQVVLKKCRFTNFESRTLIIDNAVSVLIEDCEFRDCVYKYKDSSDDWKMLGGVIYTDRPTENCRLDIINSSFLRCGGENTEKYYMSAFISNINSNVDHCKFLDCWNRHKRTNIDPENPKRTMFANNSSATNCSFENSAAFCKMSK